MSDKVTVSVRIKMDRDELWSRVWGADPWSFGSWWHDARFLEGEWDKAGQIKVTLDDPEYPEGSGESVQKVIDMDVLLEAIAKCPPHIVSDLIEDNMDSISADYIAQVAVYGECVYG